MPSNWEKKTAVNIKEPAAKEAREAVSSGGPWEVTDGPNNMELSIEESKGQREVSG